MTEKERIFFIGLIVFAAVSVACFISLLSVMSGARSAEKIMREKRAMAEAAREKLENALERGEAAQDADRKKYADIQKKVKKLSAQLADEKRRAGKNSERLARKDIRIRGLESVVEKQKIEITGLIRRVETLKKERVKAQTDLSEFKRANKRSTDTIEKLNKKMKATTDAEDSTPLGSIVVEK